METIYKTVHKLRHIAITSFTSVLNTHNNERNHEVNVICKHFYIMSVLAFKWFKCVKQLDLIDGFVLP